MLLKRLLRSLKKTLRLCESKLKKTARLLLQLLRSKLKLGRRLALLLQSLRRSLINTRGRLVRLER